MRNSLLRSSNLLGIVSARLLDHTAELSVAVGAWGCHHATGSSWSSPTYHGEEATGGPNYETHVDAAGALEDTGGGDEDTAADDATDNDLDITADTPDNMALFTVHPLRRVISALSPTDFSPSSGSSSIFSLVSLDKLVVSTSSVHYTLLYLSGVYSLPCTSRGCWVLLPPSRASLLSLPILKLSPFLNSISFLLSHSTMVFWLFCFSCMLSSLWPRYVPEYLHLGPATTVQANVPSPLPPGPWLRLLLARTGEAEDELRLTKEAASADPDWARRISGGLCKLAKMTEWPSACHALGPLSCPG